ncbi:MAG: ubiquinol-cytochrome C chaperone family protein [Geminicoccaceae bacterium]|nr:ubiquinol-cytochrome C chaperone family protein [Geminicoccaceae bacterium]MCX8099801.1 ubiquinol-cytochrome C chaperone family protein [Geminicoccaceae bacterium]MDW8368779.1 ubiquinol-cytochrome C chaperone family protein [Geminicoccaceae bacterium]
MDGNEQAGETGGWWRRWRAAARTAKSRRDTARRLYMAAVARARRPRLYAELGVPDTPDGRFEMVGIEVALLIRRLRAIGGEGESLGRFVLEAMVDDLDRNLREMGVGDLSVGRYVKRMMTSCMARGSELDVALDRDDRAALARLLERTAWPGLAPPSESRLLALVNEVIASAERLAALPDDRLLTAQLDPDA